MSEETGIVAENEPFNDLPASLVDQLKSADRPVPMITARVDREIAESARAHFAGRRRLPLLRRTALAAVAATVLIGILVLQWQVPRPDRAAVYGDLDRSGQIDIADVLAAAREHKASRPELDAFAYRVVSLEPIGDAS